jgi:hypothetical protein
MKVFLAQPSEKFHSSRKCNTAILSGELLSFHPRFFPEHCWSDFRLLTGVRRGIRLLLCWFVQKGLEKIVHCLSCCAFHCCGSAMSSIVLMQKEQKSYMRKILMNTTEKIGGLVLVRYNTFPGDVTLIDVWIDGHESHDCVAVLKYPSFLCSVFVLQWLIFPSLDCFCV